MAATNGHYLSLHSAVWSLFSPREWSEDVPEHIKRSQIPRWSILDQLYKEREEMPVASFLRAWENSNWADYCVFKEKGGAPGISLQGNHYPGRHRSDPQRVMLGKSGPERTSELSLERQIKSKDSAGRKLTGRCPWFQRMKNNPFYSRPCTLEAWDIKAFNGSISKGLIFHHEHLETSVGSQQRISIPVTLRLRRAWRRMRYRACGKFQEAILKTCSKGQRENGHFFRLRLPVPTHCPCPGQKGPWQDSSFLPQLEVKNSKP